MSVVFSLLQRFYDKIFSPPPPFFCSSLLHVHHQPPAPLCLISFPLSLSSSLPPPKKKTHLPSVHLSLYAIPPSPSSPPSLALSCRAGLGVADFGCVRLPGLLAPPPEHPPHQPGQVGAGHVGCQRRGGKGSDGKHPPQKHVHILNKTALSPPSLRGLLTFDICLVSPHLIPTTERKYFNRFGFS